MGFATTVMSVTGIVDLPRHGPNADRHNTSARGKLCGDILEKIDEIRRGLAAADPRCTGLVSEKDFKKVLYLEAGIPYSEINLVLQDAPRKGGFVGYDAWIVDYLNICDPLLNNTFLGARECDGSNRNLNSWQTGLSSCRTQGQAKAHPNQPWEEIQRVVIESATHPLSSFTLIDEQQSGFISVADLRGALYLKVGLKPEQVDMILNGIVDGDVNYGDWLSFFTTNPSPTVDDLSQFVRHGGASTSGNPVASGDLGSIADNNDLLKSSLVSNPGMGNMEPQLLVNRDGKAVLPDLMGAPGIPYTNCKAEVSDYHVTETQDMREKRREQDMRIQAILREEALHRKSQMTVDTLGGVQHTQAL